jgi:hypothetical protein
MLKRQEKWGNFWRMIPFISPSEHDIILICILLLKLMVACGLAL